MKKILAYLLPLVLLSCNHFATKKLDEESLVEKELMTINWNDVDQYPSFESCASFTAKEDVKTCFVNYINAIIKETITQQVLVSSHTINEVIIIDLMISKEGDLVINTLTIPQLIQEEFPDLEVVLRQSLNTLPDIQPALKRGQPVATTLQLPIRIKTE